MTATTFACCRTRCPCTAPASTPTGSSTFAPTGSSRRSPRVSTANPLRQPLFICVFTPSRSILPRVARKDCLILLAAFRAKNAETPGCVTSLHTWMRFRATYLRDFALHWSGCVIQLKSVRVSLSIHSAVMRCVTLHL